MNKKLFLLAMCILASSSILSARISKKKLLTKICTTQNAVNCLCKSVKTLESSVNSLEDSVETIESRLDVVESEIDELEPRIDILEEIAGTPISETTTINSDGNYIVQEDFNGCIIINASDVTLNLNKRTITSNCAPDPVITVASDRNNIVIKDGTIEGEGTNTGIKLNGNNTDCTIYGVNIAQCDRGIDIDAAEKILVEHCIVKDCTTYGISFLNSNTCEVKYCQVLDVNTTEEFAAFYVNYQSHFFGGDITFFNCIVKDITSTADVKGFFLNSADLIDPKGSGFSIDNCKVENINADNIAGIFIAAIGVNVTDCLITKLNASSSALGIFLFGPGNSDLCAVNNVITNFISAGGAGSARGINTLISSNDHCVAGNTIEGINPPGGPGVAIDAGTNTEVILNASINNSANAIAIGGAPIVSGTDGNRIVN